MYQRKRNAYCSVLALAASWAFVGSAAAQQSDQSSASLQSSDDVGQIQEVVVTARRTDENLQSVPLTVTAISGTQLQNQVVQSGLDLQKLVPTLSVEQGTQATGATYALRGIRDGVVTYLNEVATPQSEAGSAATDLQLFDLESVQAISGPQGTLFGRNSTGGAILFVPQKPTEDFEGLLEGEYGNYDRRQFTGMLNLPVNDMLQVRFDAQITRRDGVVRNLEGPDDQSIDRNAYRVGILFTPTSKITNYTLVDYGKVGGHQFAAVTYNYAGGPCPISYAACFYGDYPVQLQQAQDARGPRVVDSPFRDVLKDKEFGVQDVLTYDFAPNYSLKYIASYRESKLFELNNELSFPIPMLYGQSQNSTYESIQELQFRGLSFGGRLDWVGGLYYDHVISDNLNAYEIFAPLNAAPFSLANSQSSPAHQNNESEAIYAQATYKITDQLSLTGGLRETQDNDHSILSSKLPQVTVGGGQVCGLSSTAVNVDFATCAEPEGKEFRALTYLGSINYQVTQQVLLYATTRTGYNAGGFNQNVPENTATSYAPEHLTDYEAGIKADWHVGAMPVRTDISGFYGKYNDIQRGITEILGGSVYAGIFNAASATIYGSQFEFLALPFSFLDVSGSVGYLHTQYDSFAASLGQADATGNSFAQAPDWTIHLTATYHHEFSFGELVGTAGYAYISRQTFTDSNVGHPYAFQAGYGLVSASIGIQQIFGEPVDISLWGKNLTNKLYATNISDQSASLGYVSYFFADPRTFGVQLQYHF